MRARYFVNGREVSEREIQNSMCWYDYKKMMKKAKAEFLRDPMSSKKPTFKSGYDKIEIKFRLS